MIFLPGVVGSLLLASFVVRKRLSGKKTLEEHRTLADGTAYQVTEHRHKGHLRGVTIGVVANNGHYFGIKKESALDRLFKWIGVSAEVQTRNKEFDENYYLVSDNPALCQALSGNPSFRTAIEALHAIKLKKLEATPHLVWLYVPATIFNTERESIVAQLKVVADALSSVPLISNASLFNSSARTAIIYNCFHATWLGLGIYGLTVTGIRDAELVDKLPLMIKSGIIGSVIAAVWFVSILLLAGRSSRGHLVLLDFIFMGLAGIYMSVFSGLYDYNVINDRSEPQYFEREIVNKKTYRCGKRKRSTCYSLVIDGFIKEDGIHSKKVSSTTYHAAQIGGKARVTLRQGALGYSWTDKIELAQ